MKDIEEYVPADASESGEAAADQRHIGRILLFGAIFALLVAFVGKFWRNFAIKIFV